MFLVMSVLIPWCSGNLSFDAIWQCVGCAKEISARKTRAPPVLPPGKDHLGRPVYPLLPWPWSPTGRTTQEDQGPSLPLSPQAPMGGPTTRNRGTGWNASIGRLSCETWLKVILCYAQRKGAELSFVESRHQFFNFLSKQIYFCKTVH